MSNPFLGEIRMFAGSFAPRNWALCNGQILSISQNTALFSILGTYYGGNGTTNFALPNLQGMAPLGAGTGPGLTPRSIGETGGETSVTLLPNEMPTHNHGVNASSSVGNQVEPANGVWSVAGAGRGEKMYAASAGTSAPMSPQAISTVGGGQPHNNLQPYLTLNFIIALNGIFPSRN